MVAASTPGPRRGEGAVPAVRTSSPPVVLTKDIHERSNDEYKHHHPKHDAEDLCGIEQTRRITCMYAE